MKPLISKNYGSIGHLPNSRLGPGDHSMSAGQASILTDKARDYKDLVIVQEKLDGANVGILRQGNQLIGLTRKGHRCIDSPMEQFQLFQCFIDHHMYRFIHVLEEGERLVGEWLAMAHGTKYMIKDDFPFIAFDIMKGTERMTYLNFIKRIGKHIPLAHLLHIGQPISVKRVEKLLEKQNDNFTYGNHGALEPVEGAVWRCEREGKVDFLAKYVRASKEDGKYFHEDHNQLTWNCKWQP